MDIPELTEGQARTLLVGAAVACFATIAYTSWKAASRQEAEYARMVEGIMREHSRPLELLTERAPAPEGRPAPDSRRRGPTGRFRKAVNDTPPENGVAEPEIRHVLREDDFGARVAE